ncbi:hypothetical protein A5789_27210 [Nocardia sp. 852002-51101_SCH5132738]|uniref:hypothetical protein n=1 Tax=Nocardia sp. 852002-51101_SCH5132738 TaxID=1834095 RepID=UPI0007EB57CC|nr:hypothetical protein [Nocardia sp. 852002-51101_SCH5132738]OBA51628.1 hypothetical protein A5789_27210 [Nocardia sp. 852002-51101_SCH5132738]
MQIRDVAEQITATADIDSGPALTIATTYAAQLGYRDAYEGGQEPDVEVSEEHAEFIVESAKRSAILNTLEDLDVIADAMERMDSALDDRDAAIRRAIRKGVPVREIAAAARLSRERIYQIRDGRR